MQFMLMVYKYQERFDQTPDADKFRISEACDAWRDQLEQSGHMRQMTRLHPTAKAASVRGAGERRIVTDGPFAESKEVFAGFAIVECRDRAEAVELAKTFPGIEIGLGVEVRAVASGDEERQCWRQR